MTELFAALATRVVARETDSPPYGDSVFGDGFTVVSVESGRRTCPAARRRHVGRRPLAALGGGPRRQVHRLLRRGAASRRVRDGSRRLCAPRRPRPRRCAARRACALACGRRCRETRWHVCVEGGRLSALAARAPAAPTAARLLVRTIRSLLSTSSPPAATRSPCTSSGACRLLRRRTTSRPTGGRRAGGARRAGMGNEPSSPATGRAPAAARARAAPGARLGRARHRHARWRRRRRRGQFDAEMIRTRPPDVARGGSSSAEAIAGRGSERDLMESLRLFWPTDLRQCRASGVPRLCLRGGIRGDLRSPCTPSCPGSRCAPRGPRNPDRVRPRRGQSHARLGIRRHGTRSARREGRDARRCGTLPSGLEQLPGRAGHRLVHV